MINRIVEVPLSELRTKNAERKSNRGNNPCLICGKEIKGEAKHHVQLLTNGNIVSSDQEFDNSQGFFPVGPDCAKKLVLKFAF